MSAATSSKPGHLLLYEPRTEGHHVSWLRFITEDLLSTGIQLTLAVDQRPEHEAKIRDHLGDLLSNVTLINARDPSDRSPGDRASAVAHCLRRSGADNVFLCAFDEIASDCWRRATFGRFPPPELRGHLGGIYHRPRFMASQWSPRSWLKQLGFRRVIGQQWLRQLVFLDEYLTRDLQEKFPDAPISFLPVPCPESIMEDSAAARRQLGIPTDKRVFLFYGGGYKRKGLHLAVRAMLELAPELPAFLLCVGQQNPQGETARGLEELVRQNRALLINRYVTTAEESLSFAASDVALLPYLQHYGASGVLGQAVAARRMVIVSDEQLLGRLTRDHGLGLLFTSGNVTELRGCLEEAIRMGPEQIASYSKAAERYATLCSRAAYRRALTQAILNAPNSPANHG
ncbi:MAG: Transcriptional regulator [Pedosphaera sp.]|nr:Transcriptional regulator [Pedosphaera sp.]